MNTKHCNKCNTDKPAHEFHKRAASPDGLSAVCKSCQREYDRQRLHEPHRVKARRDYTKTEAGKHASSRAKRAWANRNPEKRAAHVIVGNALRNGLLQREPCCVCGDEDAHAHHADYSKPLAVVWLCAEHHSMHHRIMDRISESATVAGSTAL